MRIHICIVTSAHALGDVRVQRKLVESLLLQGFRVSWAGPDRQYVSNSTPPTRCQGVFYRLFEPPKTRLARLFSRKLAIAAAEIKDVDVYLAVEPDSAFVAIKLARTRGAKTVFDIHELYHQAHVSNWAPAFARPLASRLVKMMLSRVCARSDLVVGVSEGVLAPYRSASRECIVVRNCATIGFAGAPAAGAIAGNGDSFRIMHGKTSVYNGTPAVLSALALAAPRVPHLKAIMFEWFECPSPAASASLRKRIEDLKLTSVIDLRKPVQMDEMPAILRTCNVGMIAHGRNLAAGTQPNRVYEYMACGLPILAPAYDKGIVPLIEKERCGLLADFEDPASIADAIVQLGSNPALCREMGCRGREAFLAHHNWEVEVRPLIDRIRSWFPGKSNA